MAEKEIIILDRRIMSSTERLTKLLEVNAPGNVLANEVMLLFKLMLARYPTDMGQRFGTLISNAMRTFYGICQSCENNLETGRKEIQCIACRLNEEIKFGDIIPE